MRKLNLVCGMLLMFSVWGYGQEKQEVTDGYVIDGIIEGEYKAGKVDLVKIDQDGAGLIIVDSAVVENNRYTFRGAKVEEPEVYFIQTRDKECASPRLMLFLENGVINTWSTAKYFGGGSAQGTVNNNIYSFHKLLNNSVLDSLKWAFKLNTQLYGEKSEAEELEGLRQRTELMEQRNIDIRKTIVDQYPNQVYAPYVMYTQLKHDLPLEELKRMRSRLDASLNDCIYTKQLDEFFRLAEFGEGSMIPGFELPNQAGKMVNLDDFKGKYVLIDFWASWCGPCLKEMPNVVKLYKECKGKNFEIVGVSLDNKKEAWLAAIKKNDMKWIQLCDFKAWMTAPAKKCGVEAIPQTILIDPTGKVVAIGLRGEVLLKKVREVLGK